MAAHHPSAQRTTSQRGYGHKHRLERKRWERLVAAGGVRCARGAQCKHAEGDLGGLIRPGAEWHLGHDDRDRTLYLGPEHAECNLATMSHRPPRRRPAEPHPGRLEGGDVPPPGHRRRPMA